MPRFARVLLSRLLSVAFLFSMHCASTLSLKKMKDGESRVLQCLEREETRAKIKRHETRDIINPLTSQSFMGHMVFSIVGIFIIQSLFFFYLHSIFFPTSEIHLSFSYMIGNSFGSSGNLSSF